MSDTLSYTNTFLTLLFGFECGLKIASFGRRVN